MNSVKKSAIRLFLVASLVAGCGGGGVSLPKVAAGTEVTSGVDIKSDSFSFPNFGSSGTPEIFGSADVVSMFGDSNEVCASGTGATCALTAEAATWARMVNQARESGHCEGFAVMSAARFMQSATPKTDTLSNQGDVTHGIMRGFATQFEHSVQDETNKWAKKSVGEKVAAIGDALKQGKVEYVLGVYSDQGGHAVLPWKLEYVDDATVRIHVYDSNWPGIDRYVTADVKGNSWTFSFSGRDQANDPKIWKGGSSDMDLASMTARQDGTCPFCKGGARVKNSMFVIRAATLGWTVTSAAGNLSPTQNLVGNDSARPMKAADDVSGVNEDYLINATIPETKPITFELPSETHITGVTPGGAVEVQTSGTQSSVAVNETSVSSPDPSTVLTLASGNFVATANGSNTEIKSTDTGLTVRTETSTGQVVTATVTAEAPAVEVRTGSTANVAEGGYQVITQTGANEITTKTVTETGKVTETVSTGTIAATSTNVVIPTTLTAPAVDAALPPLEERLQPVVTTTTTLPPTTTTVPPTTTTVPKTTTTVPKTTTTVPPTTTTSTTTTSTSTTVPPTTTTSSSTTTTTTVPLGTPWLQHLSAATNEQHSQIVTDSSGNVYATGYFCGPSMTVGSVTLTSAGSCDGYLEKVSPSGQVVWAKRFGSTGAEFPFSIALDDAGNIYMTTTFEATFNFGASTLTYVAPQYGQWAYLKFSSSGSPIWGVAVPELNINFLDVAASGTVVALVGSLNSVSTTITFGTMSQSLPAMEATVISGLNTSTGNATWMKFVASNDGPVTGVDSAVDSSGNVYVSGAFSGSLIADVSRPGQQGSPQDMYVAKFSSAGAWNYFQTFTGSADEYPSYMAVDSSKQVYLAYGTDSPTVSLGSTIVAPASASGARRFGVVQLSADGSSVVNSKVFESNYSMKGCYWFDYQSEYSCIGGLAVDATRGVVFLAGMYRNQTLSFGAKTVSNPGSSHDIFYVGYRLSDGAVLMADRVGDSGNEYFQGANGLAVDGDGSPFLAFDSGSSRLVNGNVTYTNQGIDAYLVKSNRLGQWP